MEKFKKIFEGLSCAHGIHIPGNQQSNGKLSGINKTEKKPVTDHLWQTHLGGKGYGLGIIPINEDSKCRWGCIDIDTYNLNHKALLKKIIQFKLPLVMCRSKSGGAHLFMFFNTFVSASKVQNKLREIASYLGFSNSEVFPKQVSINIEEGDVGNYLNMPYYGGNNTTRYAFKEDGSSATLNEFYSLVEKNTVTENDLIKLKLKIEKNELSEFPPCLQILCQLGIPEGNRNNFLYNMGVALKKKYPDNWSKELERMNYKHNKPPLSAQDVIKIQKSLEKKDYMFTCKSPPVVNHCNSMVCKTRKYGIGRGDYSPQFSGLSKLLTDPPLWFLNCDGQRIRFTTEEMQQQPKFQVICQNKLNCVPPEKNKKEWNVQLNTWLAEVEEMEHDEQASEFGEFKDHLEDFCINRGKALIREDIKVGKPFTEEGTTYFTFKSFQNYLNKKGLRIKRNIIKAYLLDLKGVRKKLYINQNENIWVVAIPTFEKLKIKSIGSPIKDEVPF